jgi:hypothetical protein
MSLLFVAWGRTGWISVQWQSSDFTHELRDEHQAEADVVVPIVGIVPVTISRPTVHGVVVPATAAQNTVRTLDSHPGDAIIFSRDL